MTTVRRIGAVVAGFLLLVVLGTGADMLMRQIAPSAFSATGRSDSAPVLAGMIAYTAAFWALAGYVTGRLAPDRPTIHALVLGAIGLLVSIAATVAMWDTAPPWYHGLSLAVVLPAAWVGGGRAERR